MHTYLGVRKAVGGSKRKEYLRRAAAVELYVEADLEVSVSLFLEGGLIAAREFHTSVQACRMSCSRACWTCTQLHVVGFGVY